MSLISNPLQDPLFLPLALRVGVMLGFTLVVLVALALRQGKKLSEDILLKRWATWVAISVVMVCCLLSGPLPLAVLLIAMIVQALREYATLIGLLRLYRRVLIGLGAVMPLAALVSHDLFYMAGPVFLIFAAIQPLVMFSKDRHAFRDLAFAALGWAYIACFLTHLLLIQQEVAGGAGLLVALIAAVALSDVGAYTFGSSLGKRKLAPNISPNKTWAGAMGNVVGAYFGFALTAFAFPDALPKALFYVLPVFIAVGSLWGDLVESVLKREFEVKDAGTWLPGFGGLLDRIDSLILVAPIAYYVVRFLT